MILFGEEGGGEGGGGEGREGAEMTAIFFGESLSLTFCVCVFLQNYAYGVYLNDSRVVFFFKTYNRTYTVHSNSNSYSDGRWYKVHVVRGLRNTSLAVRPVGLSDSGAVDHVTIMTKTTEYLADGQALLFGGKDPNRSASLHL